jgi:hypothetical protein
MNFSGISKLNFDTLKMPHKMKEETNMSEEEISAVFSIHLDPHIPYISHYSLFFSPFSYLFPTSIPFNLSN